MKLITFGLLAMTVALTGGALAASASPELPLLQKLASNEYARYTTAATGGYGSGTASAVLDVVRVVRQHYATCMADKQASNTDLHDAREGERTAWGLAIKTLRQTKDDTARAAIIDGWNAALLDNDETQEVIRALAAEYDPALLTEPFTNLFKATKRPMLIHAFCLVYGRYGNAAEKAILLDKLKAVSQFQKDDPKGSAMDASNIQLALKRIGYAENGDPSRVGPASPEP